MSQAFLRTGHALLLQKKLWEKYMKNYTVNPLLLISSIASIDSSADILSHVPKPKSEGHIFSQIKILSHPSGSPNRISHSFLSSSILWNVSINSFSSFPKNANCGEEASVWNLASSSLSPCLLTVTVSLIPMSFAFCPSCSVRFQFGTSCVVANHASFWTFRRPL